MGGWVGIMSVVVAQQGGMTFDTDVVKGREECRQGKGGCRTERWIGEGMLWL